MKFGPLMKLPRELIDVESLALPRAPDQAKVYVQDRIRARGAEVEEWLRDEDTFVYVCGHKRMEAGVLDAFRAASCCWHCWAALRQEDACAEAACTSRPTDPSAPSRWVPAWRCPSASCSRR